MCDMIQTLNNQASPMTTPIQEMALLLAILERSIRDYLAIFEDKKYGQHAMMLEAKEWLFNDESLEPWSYHWICQHLDIDPQMVRIRVEKLKTEIEPFRGGGGKLNQLTVVSNLVVGKDFIESDLFHVKLTYKEIEEIYTKILRKKDKQKKHEFKFNPYRGLRANKNKEIQVVKNRNQSKDLNPLTSRIKYK